MGKETRALTVDGMSCQHCVHAIEKAIRSLAGIDSVDVSLEKKLVTVDFDPGVVNLESIKTAIDDQGYRVV
jgi:copper chaperone